MNESVEDSSVLLSVSDSNVPLCSLSVYVSLGSEVTVVASGVVATAVPPSLSVTSVVSINGLDSCWVVSATCVQDDSTKDKSIIVANINADVFVKYDFIT
jgi:hypothetical protein